MRVNQLSDARIIPPPPRPALPERLLLLLLLLRGCWRRIARTSSGQAGAANAAARSSGTRARRSSSTGRQPADMVQPIGESRAVINSLYISKFQYFWRLKPPAMQSGEPLCAYEQERQERIERNRAFLAQLGIQTPTAPAPGA